MKARVLAVLALGVVCATGVLRATPHGPQGPNVTAQTLYADAVAKETAVRTALAAPQPASSVLKAVRTVVDQYESVVRAYPTSGYCDDALWLGGQLSLEAFKKFGETRDKDTAVRLLESVASEYPSSKFAAQVPAALKDAGTARDAATVINTRDARDVVRVDARATVSSSALATIKSIRRTVLADVVRITIELDREVPFYEERLNNPARVFVDLSAAQAAAGLVDSTLRFDGDNEPVRQIRLGRHPNNVTRVVLEAGGVSSYSVYPLYSPYRLIIDCVRPTRGAAVSTPALPVRAALPPSPVTPPRLTSRPLALDPLAAAPALLGRASGVERAVLVSTPLQPVPPAPSSADRNITGGYSIARQLGVRVSRIVIDPGHGGHDPGAMGNGVTEAEVVLDVAERLEKLLLKQPGVQVTMTRRNDSFLPLQERTAIANRENADLFLSIHVNAHANSQVQGIETYVFNLASTESAKAVAARENAGSGQAWADLPNFYRAVALNNKLDESRDLAAMVQREMVDKLKGQNKSVKDLGVKQAPFVVLIGASMPSVLSEISFLTNGPEAKLLKGPAYRQRIAEALFNAITVYQTSLK